MASIPDFVLRFDSWFQFLSSCQFQELFGGELELVFLGCVFGTVGL